MYLAYLISATRDLTTHDLATHDLATSDLGNADRRTQGFLDIRTNQQPYYIRITQSLQYIYRPSIYSV